MTLLIDRYIAATNDGFPSIDQADVERDVRAALEDMIDARMEEGLDRESAERAAVVELGDPAAFAQQFRRSPRYLIGPKLFSSWWFVTRTVLLIAVPIIMGVDLLGSLATGGDDWARIVGNVIGAGFFGATQIMFWVTLTFAVIEMFGGSSYVDVGAIKESDWTIDDLPDVPAGRQIKVSDLVFQFVSMGLFTYVVIRLATDKVEAFGLNQWLKLDSDAPVFNPALSEGWFWAFIGLVAVNLLVVTWSYAVGYWTQAVTAVYLLVCLAWIAYLAALAGNGPILNPVIEQSERSWGFFGENANAIIVSIIVLITIWDAWEAVKGHWEYRKQRHTPSFLR